jgi:hypothetical protein
MHPDTSRQLAAERLADFHRRAEAAQVVRPARQRLRVLPLAAVYARRAAAGASAGTGPRSGT